MFVTYINQFNLLKMKNRIVVMSLAITILLSSCATIMSGSKQAINFTSNPADAVVFVNDINVGKTPLEAKIERGSDDKRVKIVLEGYKTYEMTLTSKTNGWVWGNILFGGIIGLIVDASNGAMYKLTPEQVNAELAKGVAINKKGKNMYIGVALEIDPKWQKIGTLVATN